MHTACGILPGEEMVRAISTTSVIRTYITPSGKLTVMRSTGASFGNILGTYTGSKGKTIRYRFDKATATKQGAIGVSVPNDTARLCDSSLEPWTLAYHRRWYLANSEMVQRISTTSANRKNNRPEWQIQSQLHTVFHQNIVGKHRKLCMH